MKILAVGCLHGKIPKNLFRILEKEKPDLILGSGDYAGVRLTKPLPVLENQAIKKYGTKFSLWPQKIQEKFIDIDRHAEKNGKKILKFLSKLDVPVYFVHGNWDGMQSGGEMPEFSFKNTRKMFFVHKKSKKFQNIFVVGYGGYRVTSMKEYLYRDLSEQITTLPEITQFKKRMTGEIEKLFKKIKGKKTILITHDPPYKTLDYLKSARKFYGEKITRKIIEKYQPLLCVCSHFHEHQGTARIEKTLVVNSGYGHKGQMALIEITDSRVKTKLIK